MVDEKQAGERADRSVQWLGLLAELTRGGQGAVWKNVEAGLTGAGDVDFVAPRDSWPEIERSFAEWASELAMAVAVCRHVPHALFLVAVDAGSAELLQLDVRSGLTFRGGSLATAPELIPYLEDDPRGFVRLRAGAEGLLKLVASGVAPGGRPKPKGLSKEGVAGLLAGDPEGVAAAAALFGPVKGAVFTGANALERGGWDRRAMATVEAYYLSKALRAPRGLIGRLRSRRAKKSCPLLSTSIAHKRKVPGDVDRWLDEVSKSHPVYGRRAAATQP